MDEKNNLLKTTARLVVVTLIIIFMVVGKSFLIPLAWALLIGLSGYRILNKVEEKTKIPRTIINSLFLLVVFLVLVGIGYFFFLEISHIFRDLPGLSETFSKRIHEISIALNEFGIYIPDHIDKSFLSDWVNNHTNLVMDFIKVLGVDIWNIILIMFYMFFLLYYRDLVIQFYMSKFQSVARLNLAKERFNKSLDLIRSYIFGLVTITLISAVMNYAVLQIFGLKFPLFFGVFLAILNLIPFIGNPIGLLVIILFAFLTKENALIPILIFVALFIMNFIQDNVIRPWIVGDKLKMNAFVIFIAIIIGGMIWGVSGMILFIPIAGVAKIILETNQKHGIYAIFFAEKPKKQKTRKFNSDPELED